MLLGAILAVEANYRNVKFSDPHQEFKDFKIKFGKSYKSWDEETERFSAFQVITLIKMSDAKKSFCYHYLTQTQIVYALCISAIFVLIVSHVLLISVFISRKSWNDYHNHNQLCLGQSEKN